MVVDNSKFLAFPAILEVETGKQLGLLQAGATGQQALSPFFHAGLLMAR